MRYLCLHLVNNDADTTFLLLPVHAQTQTWWSQFPAALAAAETAARAALPPGLPEPRIHLGVPVPEAIFFEAFEPAVGWLGIDVDRMAHGQVVELPADPDLIWDYKRQAIWACSVNDPELVLENDGWFVIQALPKGGQTPIETLELELAACLQALCRPGLTDG